MRDEFAVNRMMYEVIERLKVNKWMQFELDEYNDRVRLLNHLVEQMCESEQGITYRWHKKGRCGWAMMGSCTLLLVGEVLEEH